MKNNINREYTADQIQVLEGLEPVRKRPSMYIGSTGPDGLHHLVYEVVDNSIDEALAGMCDEIEITIMEDNSVIVTDNGSGIPTDIHPQTGKSTVETVMTILHAGGKFDSDAYQVSGGLHGVGVSVVNALSEWLIVEVKRDGKIYRQEFSRGEVITQLEIIGKSGETGTKVHFKPDGEIFEILEFNYEILQDRFREMAFLNANISIILNDERPKEKKTESFYFEGGIKEFVEYINRNKSPIQNDVFYFIEENEDNTVELALQYTDAYSESIYTFANNINTDEGGSHLVGLRTALTRVINDYAREFNFLKEGDENFIGDDVREGMTGVLSVKLREPQFEGQTKAKLGNSEMRGAVETSTYSNFYNYLVENPSIGRLIVNKTLNSRRAREAARSARDLTRRKSVLETTTLPGKLADCQSTNISETEIFLVEGDSAGGTAKQGRDRYFQAILPLKGKILNVEKARLDRILSSEEVRDMVTAFGTGIGEDFDIEKLRYGKIILMTDADVDGAHINTLLLTLLYRHMPKLIEEGHVFLALPPLYKLSRGRTEEYAYSDEQLQDMINDLGSDNYSIQRYKGLGEMNANQLWYTTMNPETRVLKKVNIYDFLSADEIFVTLMGEQVEPRREFIETYANTVKNLDI